MWRSRKARRDYLSARERTSAAAKIQALWRTFDSWRSRETKAAVQIQRVWRGFWSVVQYQMQLMDIIDVQKCARRYLAMNFRLRMVESIHVLQKCLRNYLETKKVEENRMRFFAAFKIQVCCTQLILCLAKRSSLQTLTNIFFFFHSK